MTKNNLLKLLAFPLVLVSIAAFLYIKAEAMLPSPDHGNEERTKLFIQALETGSVQVTDKQFLEYLRLSVAIDNETNSRLKSLRRVIESLAHVLAALGLLQC